MKIIKVIITLIFAIEGITKLLGLGFQETMFTNWGYPLGFMYVIGALELSGAILLWIKPLSFYANIGLILIMVGAFYTHISRGDAPQMMGLAILASALLLIHIAKAYKK